MRIDVFSLFPDLVEHFTAESLIGRARRNAILDLRLHDIRDATSDPHRTVDDSPFGGGPGMVLKPEPIFDSVAAVDPARPLLLLSPSGRTFTQSYAVELAALDGFSLLCGRYEGVDQRVRDHLVDGEISIGDFVLSGGEVAAVVIIEAVSRLLPGVLGNQDSVVDESFSGDLLEYPQYTRPWEYRAWEVPEVLRSGDHERVRRWRRAQALHLTMSRRPDLIDARGGISDVDRAVLDEFPMQEPPVG